jgi:hypothetical protein
MSTTIQTLPAAFADLNPFLETWGELQTAEERYLLRQRSRLEDLRRFYDAVAPRINEIFAHLDPFPVDVPLPAPEAALFRVTLGLTEAAPAIEVYGLPEVPFVPKPHVVSVSWNDGTR